MKSPGFEFTGEWPIVPLRAFPRREWVLRARSVKWWVGEPHKALPSFLGVLVKPADPENRDPEVHFELARPTGAFP
jgi:hypothetical protein